MDVRVSQLSKFAQGVADIKISRHPLRSDVLYVFNSTDVDIYQDSESKEWARVYKQAIVRKNPKMSYVQESFGLNDFFVEETDSLPWIFVLSLTGMPRIPAMDDRIILNGLVYTVSKVRPVNRDCDGIVECLVYPERTHVVDPLAIYSVSFRDGLSLLSLSEARGKDCVMSVIWGGCPVQFSFNAKDWALFRPVTPLRVPVDLSEFHLQDASGVVVSADLI